MGMKRRTRRRDGKSDGFGAAHEGEVKVFQSFEHGFFRDKS